MTVQLLYISSWRREFEPFDMRHETPEKINMHIYYWYVL